MCVIKGKAQLTKNVSNLVQGHMPDILVLSPEKKMEMEEMEKKEEFDGKQINPFKMFGTLQIPGQGKIGRA